MISFISHSFLQITTSSSHTINREGIERLCNFLKADEAEFKAAHDALDGMITAGGAKRKRNLLSADLPLLVFVTPDTQYLNWKGLQMYTVSRC